MKNADPKSNPNKKLTLKEYVKQGYTVTVKQFYLSAADLPAADVLVSKKGEKPVFLKGVYGKDENVPGGKQHRFGKTKKETAAGVTAKHAKNKEKKRGENREKSNGGTGAGSADQKAKRNSMSLGHKK